MKIEKDTFNLNFKKVEHISYNYMEELKIILKHKMSVEVGSRFNQIHGLSFKLVDNGGEITLQIPNFIGVSHNIAYDVNYNDEKRYFEYAEKEVSKLIKKLDMVKDHINKLVTN